jgi:hypothetical protein
MKLWVTTNAYQSMITPSMRSPGYHPVCNGYHSCNESDSQPFEKHMEQGICDDRDHYRVHLEPPMIKDQHRCEYIKKTEREQTERGNPPGVSISEYRISVVAAENADFNDACSFVLLTRSPSYI